VALSPIDKSFWESRTLFSKRVLAAGGITSLKRYKKGWAGLVFRRFNPGRWNS